MNCYKTQSGVVLVVSLILLLLLSIIGVSISQNSGLEERMAGNSRDKNLAFQAAESALRNAELSLTTLTPSQRTLKFSPQPAQGYYQGPPSNSGLSASVLTDDFWKGANANVITYTGTLDGVNDSPLYIIQDLGCLPPCTTPATDPHNYRITAYANGGTTSAVAVLQSIFRI